MGSKGARMTKAVVERLWQEYVSSGRANEIMRNRLLEHYLPMVKIIGERLYAKLPEETDIDDLFSAGVFGLIDAISGFDPSRGFVFATYASPRIKGAMLDELREMDWVPRLVRARVSALNHAKQILESTLGRHPTSEELRKHLRLPEEEFAKLEHDGKLTGLVSLSRAWLPTDSHKDIRGIDVIKDKRATDPTRLTNIELLREFVCRGLSRAERIIIVFYYFEEMTMREIGDVLGLEESRISQLHSAILSRLKQRLNTANVV